MQRLLPIVLLAAGCSGTDPSDLAEVEPGLYVLSDFDGGPPPASLSRVNHSDRTEVYALSYDSVWIESATTFRRHYETVNISISKTVPAETTLFQGASLDYPGQIYPREGGLVLQGGSGPFFTIPVLKFEVIDGRLIHRLHVTEHTCTVGQSCQVDRDLILGAVYDRR